MAGNMTKSLLRTYLKESVDEELLHFVSMNVHKVLYLSLDLFCQEANIDEDQAQTFFQAFGVSNFIAFQYILRKCLYYELSDQGVTKRSLPSLADEVIRIEMQNLMTFASTLEYDKIDRLAEDILSASNVYILGDGAALPIANTLDMMLWVLKIPKKVFKLHDIYNQDVLNSLSPSGLVIIFSRMRYSMRHLMAVKQLRQRGFRIVCFADYPHAPFIPLSDYHFLLPTTSFDYTDSSVSGSTFAHILALCLGMKREDDLYAKLHARAIETQEDNMFW